MFLLLFLVTVPESETKANFVLQQLVYYYYISRGYLASSATNLGIY